MPTASTGIAAGRSTCGRDLAGLFAPRKVAIVGASADPNKVANRAVRYMRAQGFDGEVFSVNPGWEIDVAERLYPTIDDLPDGVDVAILSIPAAAVPEAVRACGRRHIGFAVVFANGFADVGRLEQQQALLELARAGGVRLVGPNCLGLWDLRSKFAGTFSSLLDKGHVRYGSVGLVSQSGAVGNSLLLTFQAIGIGISAWLASGNEADIDALDGLAAMLGRDDTDLVILLLEAASNAGSRLLRLGRLSLESGKPVLVLKTGRSEASRLAAQSHTGKILGSHQAWNQIVEQCGFLAMHSLEHVSDTALALRLCRVSRVGRVAILCGSGGMGGLICDDLIAAGLELARLSQATTQALAALLPRGAGLGNPIDPTTVSEDVYYAAADVLLRDPATGTMILVMNSLARNYADLPARLAPLRDLAKRAGNTIAVTYFSPFDVLPSDIEAALVASGILFLPASPRLARTLGTARRWEALTAPGPPLAVPPHAGTVAPGHGLTQSLITLRPLLQEHGIATAPIFEIRAPGDAAAALRGAEGPIVLKLEASSIAHKSDAGLVRLGIRTEAEAAGAFAELRRKQAEYGGIVVAQPQIEDALEVIVGSVIDAELGRLVTVGLGGVFVELIHEFEVAAWPVDLPAARALLGRGRLATMLAGFRGTAPRDVGALAGLVSGVSGLLAERPDFVELELNPVLVKADGQGAWVVDALATVGGDRD